MGKIADENPSLECLPLKDANPQTMKKIAKVGPPLELFYESWIGDLRRMAG